MISGGSMREVTEEEFNERKRLSEERRAAKQQAALRRAEAIERGEPVEPLHRNGRQGKGEWRDGVYRMDDFDPISYLRLIDDMETPARVDPDVAFINKLSEKFPHLDPTDREAFLTAVCSRLFQNDPDRLLNRACQLLESLGAYRTPCGTLVSKYRRLPTTSGSSQSLKPEDLKGGIS
jgi:hypothetical protein